MEFLFQGKLSILDKQIATKIYDNANDVINMSITQVATMCMVSPSKITKYCHTINLDGFKELKYKLRLVDTNVANVRQTIDYQKENIDLFFSNFNYQKLETLKSEIINSDKTIFFGKGPSFSLSEFFTPRLRILTKKDVVNYHDNQLMEFELLNSNKKQLVIFLSASGKTKEIITMIKKARLDKNNKIVLISDSIVEELYSEVDLYINLLPNICEFDYKVIRSRTLMFIYFEILVQEYN